MRDLVAFLARDGHQPRSEVLRMTYAEAVEFAGDVARLMCDRAEAQARAWEAER